MRLGGINSRQSGRIGRTRAMRPLVRQSKMWLMSWKLSISDPRGFCLAWKEESSRHAMVLPHSCSTSKLASETTPTSFSASSLGRSSLPGDSCPPPGLLSCGHESSSLGGPWYECRCIPHPHMSPRITINMLDVQAISRARHKRAKEKETSRLATETLTQTPTGHRNTERDMLVHMSKAPVWSGVVGECGATSPAATTTHFSSGQHPAVQSKTEIFQNTPIQSYTQQHAAIYSSEQRVTAAATDATTALRLWNIAQRRVENHILR